MTQARLVLMAGVNVVMADMPAKSPFAYWASLYWARVSNGRPTANSKSGRNRVRAYHSLSLLRVRLPSYVFRPADVTWSNSPVIVTFGAGACANPGGASIARMTKANSALTRNLRMTVSSQAV